MTSDYEQNDACQPLKLISPAVDKISEIDTSADRSSPISPISCPITANFSIRHQDALVSIADATDSLRTVSCKIDWFHRKHAFCPHLISADDAIQIAALHRKIVHEEVPFVELQARLREGSFVDIPRALECRVQNVCSLFSELKHRIDELGTNFGSPLDAAESSTIPVVAAAGSSEEIVSPPLRPQIIV